MEPFVSHTKLLKDVIAINRIGPIASTHRNEQCYSASEKTVAAKRDNRCCDCDEDADPTGL